MSGAPLGNAVTVPQTGYSAWVRRGVRRPAASRAEADTHPGWWGGLRHVAADWFTITLPRALPPGEMVSIEVGAPDGSEVGRFLARVAHSAEADRGQWLTGCRLAAPLTEAQLRLLRAVHFPVA